MFPGAYFIDGFQFIYVMSNTSCPPVIDSESSYNGHLTPGHLPLNILFLIYVLEFAIIWFLMLITFGSSAAFISYTALNYPTTV